MDFFELSGWFADFDRQNFYYGQITVEDGRVVQLKETGSRRLTWEERDGMDLLILPGLIDSHVHIESSMLMPSRFAAQVVRFGTIATISDPHEIANVLGLEGIRLMIEDAEKACIKIHFTAPSCVPATLMESSGAVLSAESLEPLFGGSKVVALGEMMNYPGVLAADPEVGRKIGLAKEYGKPVDGHAPGLTGTALDAYIAAGISTDHECLTISEAEEKINKGMKVLIREGSTGRSLDFLYPLIDKYPGRVMLCCDDLHPGDILTGHIDRLIRKGISLGVDFFNLYQAASLNPVIHYQLQTGMLRTGDPADFIIVKKVDPFEVISTFINGIPVFTEGGVNVSMPEIRMMNVCHAVPVSPADVAVRGKSGWYKVIRARDGELITGSESAYLRSIDGVVEPDLNQDVLKIVVLNRYTIEKPAVAWISGFGLTCGAIASSIAHDSHNIIAVGTSDAEIADAINQIIVHKGGIAMADSGFSEILPLPVAGLMSAEDAMHVHTRYVRINNLTKGLGSPMKAPFMALSFMALLVIPHLKIGDKGLFDCDSFTFTDLYAE